MTDRIWSLISQLSVFRFAVLVVVGVSAVVAAVILAVVVAALCIVAVTS